MPFIMNWRHFGTSAVRKKLLFMCLMIFVTTILIDKIKCDLLFYKHWIAGVVESRPSFDERHMATMQIGSLGNLTLAFSNYGDVRLGNQMFQFASLYGIAHKNNMNIVLPKQLPLDEVFTIKFQAERDNNLDKKMQTWPKYAETYAAKYEKETEILNNHINIKLHGYFQSSQYFRHVEADIRNIFRFQIHIMEEVKEFLEHAKTERLEKLSSKIEFAEKYNRHIGKEYKKPLMGERNVTFIGVHVRRGDLINSQGFKDFGYQAAPLPYIKKAMKTMEGRHKNIIFVVSSDDKEWCVENIHLSLGSPSFIVYTNSKNPVIDMAILASCHHSIITTGTFGWWSAWLANGETIYYKDFARKGSILASVHGKDYHPQEWQGMA